MGIFSGGDGKPIFDRGDFRAWGKMKEYRDIAWMGWLLLRTASSSNRDMYFVLTREILDCYPLPRGLSRDSVTISPEHALVDLDTYGFVKIRTMHLRDILFMKLRRVTLFLATTSGGLYLSDYDGQNARLRELCDRLFARNVGRMVVGAGIVYNATRLIDVGLAHSSETQTSEPSTQAPNLALVDDPIQQEELTCDAVNQMVKGVTILAPSNSRELNQRILYLSNRQCDSANIDEFLRALDLSESACIINLLFSYGGVAHYKVHTESRSDVLSCQEFGSDVNHNDARELTDRLNNFMRDIILPVAQDNHALIICSGCDDDAFAAALEHVMRTQQRLGNICQFKILTFVNSFQVHYKAERGEGVAGQVVHKCSDWAVRLDAISDFMADVPEDQLQRCDMIECSSAVIVFEAYDNGVVQLGPSKAFQTRLLRCLARQAPAIAVQMYAADWGNLSELCHSGIPILLLDSRERAITMRSAPRQCSTQLATLSDAFPRDVDNLLSTITSARDEGTKMRAREALLERAGEMIESQVEALGTHFIVDYDDSSAAALLHAALWYGISREEVRVEKIPLHKRIEEKARADARNQFRSAVARPGEPSVQKAVDILSVKRGIAVSKAKLLRIQKWLRDNEEASTNARSRERAGTELEELESVLQQELDSGREHPCYANGDFSHIAEIFSNKLTFSASFFEPRDLSPTILKILSVDRLPKDTSLPALLTIQNAWNLVESYHFSADRYKLITKLLYATLLCVGVIASSIALFKECEESCKQTLLLSMPVVSSVALYCMNIWHPSQRWQELRGAAIQIESEVWRFRTRTGVYRVAFDGSNRAEVDGRFSQRIQELKNEVSTGADLNVVTNAHQQNSGADSTAHLCNLMPRATAPDIHAHISSDDHMRNDYGSNSAAQHAADQSERAANLLSSRSGHEASGEMTPLLPTQDRAPEESVQDDHFSPLQPDEYLQLRLLTAIKFYEGRLSDQIIWSRLGIFGKLISTVLFLVLTYYQFTDGAIVSAAIFPAVIAWLRFQGTDAKIARYNDVVSRLKVIRIQWQGLDPIKRKVAKAIDDVVEAGENSVLDEMHLWRSTSAGLESLIQQAAQLISAQASTTPATAPEP